MVYAKRVTSMTFSIQNVIFSIYSLCLGGHSLIVSDQEYESIWKMKNWLSDIGFKTYGVIPQ